MDSVGDNALWIGGLAAAILAFVAWAGDRRRLRRADLDRVGLMPWRGLAFWASLAAAVLGAAAFEQWLGR